MIIMPRKWPHWLLLLPLATIEIASIKDSEQ